MWLFEMSDLHYPLPFLVILKQVQDDENKDPDKTDAIKSNHGSTIDLHSSTTK
jgi:hypothetical protein